MSQGGFVTLVGFVAMEPSLRVTKDGHHVADVRVGTASRMLDKQTGEWVDGETSFYTVTCWRRLACRGWGRWGGSIRPAKVCCC